MKLELLIAATIAFLGVASAAQAAGDAKASQDMADLGAVYASLKAK